MKRFFSIAMMFLVLLAAVGAPLHAQTKKKLQEKKKKLQGDITYTNTLIKKNKAKQEVSIGQLEKISKNIETRTELIRTFESEIRMLERDISVNQKEVAKLEKNLLRLRKSYAQMVYVAWLNRHNLNRSMFILASENFNQAFRRIKYFQQIGEIRRMQVKSITDTRVKLEGKVRELSANRDQKGTALNEQTSVARVLESEKREKEQLVIKLKGKEKELMEKVKKSQREADQLAAKIAAIIEKEIREAELKKSKTTTTSTTKPTTKTSTTTKPVTTKSTTITGNTEGGTLSSSFESSKGKLPWPVEKGVITGKFGVQAHPVLERVEIKNDGVDISTDANASVRAVFKGEVSGAFKVDGYENVLIIRHGSYLTVYSHLSSIAVKKGDNVSAKQKIGTVATSDEGKTFMNFQVRNGSAIQNPVTWLSR